MTHPRDLERAKEIIFDEGTMTFENSVKMRLLIVEALSIIRQETAKACAEIAKSTKSDHGDECSSCGGFWECECYECGEKISQAILAKFEVKND